ncbi:MAG: hypothetical protein ACI8RD_006045, partial [Bacillariaceae sp.]
MDMVGATASLSLKLIVSDIAIANIYMYMHTVSNNLFPIVLVDTDNETCPRCNFLLSDDDVVCGWTPGDSNDYTTKCP